MAVTFEDVGISLGRPIASFDERGQITQWIADARLIIGARLGDLALLDQDVLDYVVREAVVLKVRNPEGKQSEQIDDYKYVRSDDHARGQVWITDAWWAMLTPDVSTGAFSIGLAGNPGYRTDIPSALDGWA